MPGDNEQVNYSYTGDITSLKKATKDAVSLLGHFEQAMKGVASKDTFKASATSVTSFQRSINGITKEVNRLVKSINSSGTALDSSLVSGTSTVSKVTKDLADVLDYLDKSTSVTSSDLNFLTEVLRDSRSELESVSSRAQMLTTTLAPLKSIEAKTGLTQLAQAATETEKSLDNTVFAGFRVQEAYQETGKSAEESAQYMQKAFKFESMLKRVTDVSNNIKSSFSSILAPITNVWSSLATKLDPVISRLQSFKGKAAESFGRVKQLADTVASAFRRVQQSEDGAANSAVSASGKHDELESNIEDLAGDVDKETDKLKQEEETLKSKEKQVSKSSNSHKKFSVVLKAVGDAVKKELSGLKNLGNNFKKLVSTLAGSNNVFSKFKNLITSLGLVEAANQSIKYAENVNLFNVAMGSSVDKGREFVDQMQEVYGMDPSNVMRYAGNFYQLADAIKMPDDAASNLSLGLTKATNDIASLFNVDVETVFENLSSGMQGMTKAVRKYGMDIRNVTLEQTALNYGITENVDSMSEADRQALRFITMMDQAKNATTQLVEGVDGTTQSMGDFANTIEQPANQLRIFKEQISQLGRSIGDLFIVPLRNALQYINGFIMAIRTAITFIGSLVGATSDLGDSTKSLDGAADGVEGIGSAASKAAKDMKKFLAPFDELNVMQSKQESSDSSDSESSALNPKLQEAIAGMSLGLEDVQMKANKVRDALLSFLGFKVDAGQIISWDASSFEANLINKFPQWTSTIKAVFDNWSSIAEGFKSVMWSLGKVAEKVWGKISEYIGKFVNDDTASTSINTLDTSLSNLASTISSNSDSIADFLLALPALLAGFKVGKSAASIAMAVSKALAGMSGSAAAAASSILPVVGVIAAVVAAIVLLYTNSSSFAESFNNLLTSLWTGLQPTLENIKSLCVTIWESLQKLWAENVQPMLNTTGDALAPVLDTITSLWNNVSVIIADFVSILESAWVEIIEPVFAGVCDIVSDVMEAFQVLWEEFLGPIIEEIGDSLERMWTNFLKPIIDKVISIVSDVIDIIMVLWNAVLAPIVQYLVNTVAPVFKAVFQTIWGAIEFVMGLIFSIIDTLMGVLAGVIEFIAGVFTGDWKKALSGLLNIFGSLGNGIIGVFESALNCCISLINSFLSFVVGRFKSLVNNLGKMVEGVAKLLGFDIKMQVNWKVPQIPKVSIPRIPTAALATGGVVTSPTYAMIGEGRYDEAVLPLGNSPQMKDLVNQIAEAVKGRDSDGDMVPVQVYMDGDLFFETMARKNRAATIRTGVNPMMGG